MEEPNQEFTREILRKVRQIEIRSNRLVSEALSGSYHSAFKGEGIDFEEVREYQPGDEVRSIDWNVTAKMGFPFVKQYREERELTIILAIDISNSEIWGSEKRSKRERLAELGALLSFSANRNGDKVGLVLFSDKVEKYLPPAKGQKHVLRILRDILFHKNESKKTDLNEGSVLLIVLCVEGRSFSSSLISLYLNMKLKKNQMRAYFLKNFQQLGTSMI